MGETKWTEEQLKAIDTRNCNLLVAAAAGSGKTAVLVERIIKMITDKEKPIDIDKLLVVTFTNAAAAEMRERIAVAISKELDKYPNSKNLQRQLALLNRANITTMHSFCLDTIKNNYHKIDLDPKFRIGDQTECILLKLEVIDEVFEEKYDNDDEAFINLVEIFNSYKNDDKLKDLIIELYNFTMAGPWPEKWLKENAEKFNIHNVEDLNNTKWIKLLKESILIELNGYIKTYEKAIDIINYTDGLEAYFDTFDIELNELNEFKQSINLGLEDMYNSLYNIKFGRLKSVKKDKVSDENAQENVKAIRDSVKKYISSLKEDAFSITPKEILNNINGAYPYINTLSNIVIEFSHKFTKKKKEKNILDFNDLEHFCLKILIDHDEEGNIVPSSVALNYRKYFDEVLVDEYQDSNNIQETIINLVSRKETKNPNVFMVGDVKQSIYRFRQAQPELFIKKYNEYKLDEGINRKITLYKNFRSRKQIINSVNYIFKMLMSEEVGELNYTKDEFLNLGANYQEATKELMLGGPVEINIIDKSNNINYDFDSSESGSAENDEEENSENIELEGNLIVNKIKELMQLSNEGKYKVLDKQSGEYRTLQYRDIVILLRATKNSADILLEKLGEAQLPVYADTGTGYFESIEIRTIMSLLKIIDNPLQDIPIISVLKSPIVGFSAEELVDIRLINKEKYIYENIIFLTEQKDIDNISSELVDKSSKFIEKLNNWRKKSLYMPIDEFIWYLYMDTSYYGFVGSMPNGVLRQANLKIFFQRAKQFEETSFKGVFNFINFINKLIKSSGDMGSAKILGENEDVIRIMSIHKSKGLEFPIVFLCGTGKNFNLMDLNKNLLYHQELGFGPDYIDIEKRLALPTIAKESIKKKLKLEILSEELRVLYVALTRAKEKLIITGCVNNLEKSINRWYNSSIMDEKIILPSQVLKGKSYIDWIGMALCKHNISKELLSQFGYNNDSLMNDDSEWKINVYNKNSLTNKEILQEDKENNLNIDHNIDEKIYKNINEKLSYIYPYKYSTTLKSNISVSDLKKASMESEYDIYNMFKEKEPMVPNFLKNDKELTGSQRGTIIHLVMKTIDLNKVDSVENIKAQIKNMIDNDLITDIEAKVVRPYKILKFFESSLGKSMLESYQDNPNNVYREVPFYTKISSLEINKNLDDKYKNEKIRLQGIIDCFFINKNKIILLDYKTDYVENNENELIKKYFKQLEYYSDAIYKLTHKKVDDVYIYSFYLDKEILIK